MESGIDNEKANGGNKRFVANNLPPDNRGEHKAAKSGFGNSVLAYNFSD
jgi:hypothetical protein